VLPPRASPRRAGRALAALACLSIGLSLAGAAHAGPKDAQAKKALQQALDEDYLDTRFDDAESRLRAALEACGASGCSPGVKAKLHAALGCVLAGGKKELEDAREEFVEALALDPKVQPDPGLVSDQITFAFEQAKKQKGGKPARKKPEPPPPPPPDTPSAAEIPPDELPGSKPGKEKKDPPDDVPDSKDGEKEPEPSTPVRKNWISLTFSPDFSIVSGTNVCTQDSQANSHYVCGRQDATNSRYAGTPTQNNGDNINAGIALSTIRLMLGYDRLIIDNLTLGARVGFAFNGANVTGASFLPVHLEARLGIWLRHQPFVAAVVRPYFMVSGGLAQVDSKVPVQVLEDGNVCGAMPPGNTSAPCTKASNDGVTEPRQQTLSAYRQAGLGFAALSFGIQFAPTSRVGIFLAARGNVTFPVLTFVLSPELGISIGF
jgi:hypothetical protein